MSDRTRFPDANDSLTITALAADVFEQRLGEFGTLLKDCLEAGASVNFVLPFSHGEAEDYWRAKILPDLAARKRVVLVARRPTVGWPGRSISISTPRPIRRTGRKFSSCWCTPISVVAALRGC